MKHEGSLPCKQELSPDQFTSSDRFEGFQVLTAVVMKSIIFRDITPCGTLKINRRFGETPPCLPPAFAMVSSSAYSSTLRKQAICSSET
jgi:hypothetical protein